MSWHIYPAAAAAAVRRSVRPCRHGTKRVLFSRHLLHVGGTYSSGPPDRWWSVDIFAAERHIQKKRKKEIWVSLSRRAQIPHSTRTKVHGSAPLHHTIPQTCTTTCYLLLLRRQRCRMFQIQDVLFFCSAVLLPETYGIPYHHHAPL